MSKFTRTGCKNRLFCKKPVFKKAQELFSAASQALAYSLILSHLSFIPYVYAGPTGANVVGGNGHVHYNGNVTDIHQVSSRLAIDWASYNVGANETVNYDQLTTDIALNRILSTNGSEILGRINAKGTVVLVNPNGIFFGSGSQVNVGGLIASGLDISSADFMNGNNLFKSLNGTTGIVENAGILNASLGGSITLLGKQVINAGLITANLGAVNLAAGKEVVLTFDAAGLVGVRVTKEILQNELGVDPAILNSGEITAESGRILLTASQSQDIFSRAVNSHGIEQASSVVVNADGTFTLGGGADVLNTGSINVSSLNESDAGQIVLLGENINSTGAIQADALKANGGDIELHANNTTTLTENSITSARAESSGEGGIVKVLGNKVAVAGNSQLDVSGAQGGGQLLIGGDYQGSNIRIRNALHTYIGKNVELYANALYRGNGGKVINWSDNATWFYASAFAQGGSEYGNGGLVEISAKALNFNGFVSTTAVNGVMGTLLFDPTNIFIHDQADGGQANDADLDVINGADGGTADFHIGELALEGLSESSNILLEATNNITINNLLDNALTLKLDEASGGSIVFTANSDNTGGGGFFMHATDTIKTQGGSVTINGASIEIGNIDTQGGLPGPNNDGLNGGDITITSDTTLAVTGVINANGGDGDSNGSNKGGDAGNILIQAGTDISTTAVSSNGGKSEGNKTAGNAGTIDIISTAGNLTASGDISATGGLPNGSGSNGDAATINLQATSGLMTLQRNINAEGFTNADITINAQTLKLNGAAAQQIRGSKINITSSNALQLLQNLSINSAAGSGVAATNATDVILNANVDYNGIGATGSLVIGAGNDIILNANITDSVVDTDQLSVTLNSNNDGGANGDIAINGSIATNNALFSATGTNYDARSTAGSKYTINTGTAGATLLMTGDVNLGEMVVGGALDITSGGYILQGSANADSDDLSVTGTSLFNSNSTANDNITINSDANNFTGAVSITKLGNNGTTVTLNSASATTILDTVDVQGSLVVNAQQNLSLTGAVSVSTSNTNTTDLNFGINNANSTYNQTATASITANSTGVGDTMDITISGGTGDNIFNFNSGSSFSLSSGDTLAIDGNTGIDIFNVAIAIPGRINAGAGADIINMQAAVSAINDLRGDAGVDTLNGFNMLNQWTVSATDRGSLNTSTVFQGIESIVGGNLADTLTGPNQNVAWDIGAVSGNLAIAGSNLLGTGFSGFENYTGGSGDDTFVVQATGTFGLIDGGLHNTRDILNLSARAVNSVTIGTEFVNIERVIGNDINSTLTGTNTGTTWVISGPNDGSAGGIEFVDFNNITGGTGDDTFQFNTAGSISGTTDAGAGNDTVDYSNRAIVDISLATAFSGVINAETIRGNNTNSTLRADNINNTWIITDNNDGTVAGINFEDFNNLTGGTADDSFVYQSTGVITGIIDGNLATTQDTVDISLVAVADVTLDTASATAATKITGIEKITGNNINSRLTAQNINNSWSITGNNDGSVAGVAFVDFTALSGGSADDSFVFTGAGSISGLIDGKGHTTKDTVDGSALASFNVSLGTGLTNIEEVIGNNANSTLTGLNADSNWNITGVNDGNVGGLSFIDFTNLVGGSGDDNFVFASAGSISGLIDGGAENIRDNIDYSSLAVVDVSMGSSFINIEQVTGNNTSSILRGQNINNTWNITAANDGTVAGLSFINFTDLVGGNQDDTFIIGTNGSLSGGINGGAHVTGDTVDGRAQTTFNVVLGATGFSNIEQIVGNNTTSRLTGADINNTWNITGANDGNIGGMVFTDFVNLTGGAADDNFIFASGGSISGIIDGAGETLRDQVDGRALTTFNVNLNSNMINIERFIGNNVDSSIAANNINNTWNITGANDGNVNGIEFFNFVNLTGGTADDNFTFSSAGSLSGLINGGNATTIDIVDGSALTNFDVVLGTGIINVEQITGNNTNSTITATNQVNIWNITGANDGDIGNVSFFDFVNLTGGADDDRFVFFDGGSISGIVAGGLSTTRDVFDYTNAFLSDVSLTTFFTNTSGIEVIIGNDASTSRLTGQTGSSTWSVTGNNDGNYTHGGATVDFINFQNLTGNSGVDAFVFTGAGALSGLANGAAGADTYDASALAGPVAIIVNQNVSNIETITGNNINSSFTADNVANTWNITGVNDGNVGGVAFIDFNNITGGTQDDVFLFSASSSISGLLDGGAEVNRDIVSFANLSNFVLDLSNPTTSITDIELIVGNNVDTTIIGENVANTWNVTGGNDGTILNSSGSLSYFNFVNLVGGNANDDFVFSAAGSVSGQINGGGGVNTINYSARSSVSVNLNPAASNGISNINSIIGNNLNSIINGANQINSWSLSGHNDGSVNGMSFTDFNVLRGGSAADTFNIQATGSLGNIIAPDSDLQSVISGFGGDDVFNITLNGANSGSVKLNGGAGVDSINLFGADANYVETYSTSEPGGYERLSFTQATNIMEVNFQAMETVRDGVAVAEMIVNGTVADDTVLLNNLNIVSATNFQLGTNSIINYTGKDSLTVNTGDGVNDLIDIQGDIILNGILSLNAESVTNSAAALITADTLLLDSVNNAGLSTAVLRTNVVNLGLRLVTGDVYIDEDNNINLVEMSTAGITEIRNFSGDITDSADLSSTGIVKFTSDNGSIFLDNNNQLSGELSLLAQNGNVTLINGVTTVDVINTQNLSITANGGLTDTATSVISVASSTTLTAPGQSIVLDGAAHVFNDLTVNNAADVLLVDSAASGLTITNVAVTGSSDISSNGSIRLNTLSAGATASLTTSGELIDSNIDDMNITASLLQISAVSGIGSSDEIETQVRTMDVVNSASGNVEIRQTGVVDLVALKNTGVTGDINFFSDQDINFNPGSVVANRDSGALFMNTQGGSFLGLGDADITNPDITAQRATFFGRAGTFGTFQRPLTLDVPGSVFVDTRASFNPQFVPPGPSSVDTRGIDFTVLGALSAVAGEQLVEVESLGDIDPAIFTDLQNYSLEETSIRLPRDQLFDDELEAYDRL